MKTKTTIFSKKTYKAEKGKKSTSKPTIKVDMHTWNTSDPRGGT